EDMRMQAHEARIEADLHLGLQSEVMAELQALVATDPLRERLHALLMLALYRDGRRSDALDAFRRARRVLVDEIGVEPGAELQRLHQQILDGDPALNPVVTAHGAAGPMPPVIPRQLPAAVATFVRPEPGLNRLGARAAAAAGVSAEAVTIVVIGGTAGVGKTALAIQWAHRAADRFPDGQLYINLRGFGPDGTPMAPTEGLGSFLEALQPRSGIPAGPDP